MLFIPQPNWNTCLSLKVSFNFLPLYLHVFPLFRNLHASSSVRNLTSWSNVTASWGLLWSPGRCITSIFGASFCTCIITFGGFLWNYVVSLWKIICWEHWVMAWLTHGVAESLQSLIPAGIQWIFVYMNHECINGMIIFHRQLDKRYYLD